MYDDQNAGVEDYLRPSELIGLDWIIVSVFAPKVYYRLDYVTAVIHLAPDQHLSECSSSSCVVMFRLITLLEGADPVVSGWVGCITLDLEPGMRYDVVVLAATRTGFPTIHEDEWRWVSRLVTGSEVRSPGNAVMSYHRFERV